MSLTVVLSLVQDLAIAAPVLAAAGSRDTMVLVAERLAALPRAAPALAALERDRSHAVFAHTGEALAALNDRAGLVLFASESRSPHHRPTHALAAALPRRFVSATLQHGYECIGFLHNAAHDATRADAGFAADIAAAWFPPERVPSLPPADRAKHYLAGSTLFLAPEPARWLAEVMAGTPAPPARSGPVLVCENVQSVRLQGAPAAQFMAALGAVARERPVTLRPHPAGAFAKGEADPPPGVRLDARPIAEADLDQYAAAITPPSTVAFDLMRHDVPVAIWTDVHGMVDHRHYGPLPRVTEAADWLAFFDAPPSTDGQRAFIRALGFPADTPGRFETLFRLGDDVAASGDRAQHGL